MLVPALISLALSAGVLLIILAVVLSRSGRDPWARMDGAPVARDHGAARERSAPVKEYLNRRLQGSTYAEKVARQLTQADVRLSPAEFVAAQIGAAAVGGVLGVLLAMRLGLPVLVGVLVMALANSRAPALVVRFKRAKRVKLFNAQLADTTMMLANSLKAGYSLLQSMDLISKDAPAPTSVEYRRVVQEVGVGLTLTEALANLLRRVPSDDLDLMITAIGVQQEVGGNLSTVLEGIAHTIRERVRIKGEIGVLTSQGRYSGYVITALPIGMGAIITLINPGYMAPLFTFPWIIMPIVSLILIGIAYFIIRKIVNIEV